jgi:hypothetical protein
MFFYEGRAHVLQKKLEKTEAVTEILTGNMLQTP